MRGAEPYHTALARGALADGPPTERWESAAGDIAMVWSIDRGAPPGPSFDLIYADLPWRAGYDVFARRAGLEHPPVFGAVQRAADHQAKRLARMGGVAIYTASRALFGRLLEPDRTAEVDLNGDLVGLAIYGQPRIDLIHGMTAVDLIGALAQTHDRVWDPCCGYGRTGRIFAAAGKRWTLTDINAGCIGRIALDAPGWGAPT